MYDYHTAYDPNAEDMAPTRDEAAADERAIRRRKQQPLDRDGGLDLLACLDASTIEVVKAYRNAGVL
jgi:hypothetical protein